MMALDHFCRLSAAFHYIRVNGALSQEVDPAKLSCFLFKHPDKLRADDFSFFLGIGDT
jgi:hypothetical protein